MEKLREDLELSEIAKNLLGDAHEGVGSKNGDLREALRVVQVLMDLIVSLPGGMAILTEALEVSREDLAKRCQDMWG